MRTLGFPVSRVGESGLLRADDNSSTRNSLSYTKEAKLSRSLSSALLQIYLNAFAADGLDALSCTAEIKRELCILSEFFTLCSFMCP